VAVGDYAQIEHDRRRAFKRMRSLYDAAERAANEHAYRELTDRREQYLRDLLARLPFRWHIEHAYTPQETGSYGGADHIVVDEEVRVGRLIRQPGDALSRVRKKFWGLSPVFETDRLPSSLADIKIAERIVAASPAGKTKKSAKQLDAEIAELIVRSR
jgi:hypothetical protein